jgi:uncharacterized membrane protein
MPKWIYPAIFSFAALIASLIVYNNLPDVMAIHFDPSGEADNFVSKPLGAFLAPLLIWIVFIMMSVSMKLEPDENKRQRAEAINLRVMAIVGALLLAAHLFTLAYNLGHELNAVKFAAVAIGLVFVLIGNLVPRMGAVQNKWKGPKLPEKAHRRFAQFQGRLMFGAGFVFILLTPLPYAILSPVFFALLILYVLIHFGSMFYFSRLR